MRATKPRGTRTGNWAAAAAEASTRPSRPSAASSSRGSRMASRQACCQPGGCSRAGAAVIMSVCDPRAGGRRHPPHILAVRGRRQAGDSMATLGMNDVKNGQKILVNNEPAIITETDYVKPGKGQAFTRVRYRLIKTGRVQEITMKSTDSVEAADVIDTDMQYLYSDGEYWHFMNPETFEKVQADEAGMG